MKYAVAILLLALCLVQTVQHVHAEQPWIDIHLASNHSESQYYDGHNMRDYNETNLGLGVMYPINQYVEYGVGTYKNSYYRQSFYTGFDLHTSDRAPVGYGVTMGIISGYDDKVMVLPHLRVGNRNVRLKLGVLPGEVKLVTLTVGVRF